MQRHLLHCIQWNPSIERSHPWGTTCWPLLAVIIIGDRVAYIEGLFCTQTVHLGPACLAVISQLAFIQGWPLRGVPLYSVTIIACRLHCTAIAPCSRNKIIY